MFFDNKAASKNPWTKEVWFYDYRTNVHHTPKKSPMRQEHLKEFIELYNGKNINKRKETWSEDNPDECPPIYLSTAFKRHLIRIWRTRATYPLKELRQHVDDIDAAFDLVARQTNSLHALVNNAGIITQGCIDWIPMEMMRKVMEVNFFGHVAMMKKFLPYNQL